MIYSIDGVSTVEAYDVAGTSLQYAYDIDGNQILDEPDYDEWTTEYQHTILQARDAWKTEYRADNTIVPILVHTDQHNRLKAATKPTFDYLKLAVKWPEVSAIIGLGDVCGNLYNTTDLNNMLTALSSIPAEKQINIQGNHDNWLTIDDPINDETFTLTKQNYFNNSAYHGNVSYGNRGNEIMIDEEHSIKYLCVSCFYFLNGTNYKWTIPTADMTWILNQMSTVDDYDIVVLSHIQPLGSLRMWYVPAVDGNPASSSQTARNGQGLAPWGWSGLFEGLAHARKNKASGTITDSEGVTHSFDFSGCRSDLLCWLCGHHHADTYAYDDGDVPIILFDSYSYANYPLYMVNIDRTMERVNVWKFDEAGNIYNYQVPFTEPVSV